MIELKRTAITLLEKNLLKTGRVLAVRYWEPSTFVEIDLHLPGLDMSGWTQAQHLKCRVGPFTYRDYSVAGWDEETRTGTLYVDAGHDGPGSNWAKSASAGDVFQYAGCGRSPHAPAASARPVFLGDESSLGHFLSLQQLLSNQTPIPNQLPVSGQAPVGQPPAPNQPLLSGAIAFSEPAHRRCFADYLRLPLEPVCGRAGAWQGLRDWLGGSGCLTGDAVFYVAGNMEMVQQARRLLREKGVAGKDIKVHGFWR